MQSENWWCSTTWTKCSFTRRILVWTTISHPSWPRFRNKCESMVFHGGTSAWTASYLGGLDKDWTPPWVFPYVNQEFTNCSSAGTYLENRVPPHIIFLVWTTLVEAPLIRHQFTDCSSKEHVFLDEHTRFTYMNSVGTVQEQITFFQWRYYYFSFNNTTTILLINHMHELYAQHTCTNRMCN